jgi:hypothetical protein
MNKRSRLAALLGAGLLTFAVAGVALATDAAWDGNGFPSDTCTADGSPTSMLWVWTGDSPTALTINGELQSGSWVQQGQGAFQFEVTVDATNYPPTTTDTFVTYTGTAGVLTLSHCEGASTPTPVPTPTPGGGGGGESDVPTQPATDSIGSTGNSGPTDTAWLLVVGLGVLLASIVVLTPARAKSRR